MSVLSDSTRWPVCSVFCCLTSTSFLLFYWCAVCVLFGSLQWPRRGVCFLLSLDWTGVLSMLSDVWFVSVLSDFGPWFDWVCCLCCLIYGFCICCLISLLDWTGVLSMLSNFWLLFCLISLLDWTGVLSLLSNFWFLCCLLSPLAWYVVSCGFHLLTGELRIVLGHTPCPICGVISFVVCLPSISRLECHVVHVVWLHPLTDVLLRVMP